MAKFSSSLNTTPTQPALSSQSQRARSRSATSLVGQIPPSPPAATTVMPHHHAQTDTVNAAGGKAFRKSPAFELLSLIFTTLLHEPKGKFYESEAQTLERLKTLVKHSPRFAAQAAVWARRVLGLRSISHAVAALVCYYTKGKGETWVKQFVESVIYRPDDALEIVAAYFAFFGGGKTIRKPGGKRGKKVPVTLPYPLKKGIAAALSKLDGYRLAKYQKTGQAISLVDVFNLVHPKPTPENAEAFRQFVRGELKNVDTWEARLSAAGSDPAKKAQVWRELVAERKLGYFATLRNLRNILEQAPEVIPQVCEFITNPKAVENSLILPFQFVRAYKEVLASGFVHSRVVADAIEEAVALSCRNIPKLPGRTLVALDESASMGGVETDRSPANIGSLFAAIVLKSQPGAHFMSFANRATYKPIRTNMSLFATLNDIRQNWNGGSTNFHSIFEAATTGYDNIIILSDGEGWQFGDSWDSQAGAPTAARRQYEQRHKVLPFIVMFDLTGSKTMMFPEDSVAVLSGFSDKIFALLTELRKNPSALVHEVTQVDFQALNEADGE